MPTPSGTPSAASPPRSWPMPPLAARDLTLGTAGRAAAVAVVPDLDILAGRIAPTRTASEPWPSSGSSRGSSCGDAMPARCRFAAAIAAAYGSHLLLDWLGKDTSSPPA